MAALAAGQLIDARYTLVKRLGAGTFGEVWKARDGKFPNVERFVAIKFLKEEHLANQNIVARFEKEADALAALHHEHVIAVSDRGDWAGGRYMAMEFVAGRTLEQWLEEHQEAGRLPELPAVQRLFDQVCAGVGAAHAVTLPGPIVHRDLKPENVMLRPGEDGPVVKVLDFGIARLGGRSQESRTGFYLQRQTSGKKLRASLARIKAACRRRRHLPIADQHAWLRRVVSGHVNYYGVPSNYRALHRFHWEVTRMWHRSRQRRSQGGRWREGQRARFLEGSLYRFPASSIRGP